MKGKKKLSDYFIDNKFSMIDKKMFSSLFSRGYYLGSWS